MAKKRKYEYEWPRPMVTVDVALFSESKGGEKVLLIKRGNEPYKGMWALPGGFVDIEEELEAAAARELAEETGIEGIELDEFAAFGTVGRDPRGRTISVVYTGLCNESTAKLRAGDDACDVKWFDLKELPRFCSGGAELPRLIHLGCFPSPRLLRDLGATSVQTADLGCP